MSEWQDISSAPKDGAEVELLSTDGSVWKGRWDPEGTSWVDENGSFDGDAHHLEQTGFWLVGHSWFQPDEVTHWRPSPPGEES